MKKEYALGVVFFGGLWGILEATLGDALYSADVPHASIPLTVIGFAVLAVASAFFPRAGAATLIASCAMLYKFLNVPFFGCHLLGILLTGIWYDVLLNVIRMKRTWMAAGLAVYGSYASFAAVITYVFGYDHWVQGGFAKIVEHVGIDGSLAALACIIVVPLSLRLGAKTAAAAPEPFRWRASLLAKGIVGLTAALWLFNVAVLILSRGPRG